MTEPLDPIFVRATEAEVRDQLAAVAAGSIVGDWDSAMLAVAIFALVDALHEIATDAGQFAGEQGTP